MLGWSKITVENVRSALNQANEFPEQYFRDFLSAVPRVPSASRCLRVQATADFQELGIDSSRFGRRDLNQQHSGRRSQLLTPSRPHRSGFLTTPPVKGLEDFLIGLQRELPCIRRLANIHSARTSARHAMLPSSQKVVFRKGKLHTNSFSIGGFRQEPSLSTQPLKIRLSLTRKSLWMQRCRNKVIFRETRLLCLSSREHKSSDTLSSRTATTSARSTRRCEALCKYSE